MVPMASHDQISYCAPHFDAISSTMPVSKPIASHEQNSHVAPNFDYIDQTYAIIPLMMQM